MIVSLGLEELAIVVSELEAARRVRLEQADATDDEGVASDYRMAAERFARIVDELTGAAYRWHLLDTAQGEPAPSRHLIRTV